MLADWATLPFAAGMAGLNSRRCQWLRTRLTRGITDVLNVPPRTLCHSEPQLSIAPAAIHCVIMLTSDASSVPPTGICTPHGGFVPSFCTRRLLCGWCGVT